MSRDLCSPEPSSSYKQTAYRRPRLCINNFLESTPHSPGRPDLQNLQSAGITSGKKSIPWHWASLCIKSELAACKESAALLAVKRSADSLLGKDSTSRGMRKLLIASRQKLFSTPGVKEGLELVDLKANESHDHGCLLRRIVL